MPIPKALAGHRALSLKALILTAKSPENTRKMSTRANRTFARWLFRRRLGIWRCCARLATRYCLKVSLWLSLRGREVAGNVRFCQGKRLWPSTARIYTWEIRQMAGNGRKWQVFERIRAEPRAIGKGFLTLPIPMVHVQW